MYTIVRFHFFFVMKSMYRYKDNFLSGTNHLLHLKTKCYIKDLLGVLSNFTHVRDSTKFLRVSHSLLRTVNDTKQKI